MTNRQKRGWLLVMFGLCMVLSALLMHSAEQKHDALAGENSAVLLQQLKLSRPAIQVSQPVAPVSEAPLTITPMSEKDYLGYSMIGTLRIPSLSMELPVLSSWSYELLEVAPCRYSGSIPEENMIIMGHNYKSHFTPLHQISLDATVEFEDVNGVITIYTVEQIDILHKSQVDHLISEYPLTLFTCTAGGQNRRVVRCSVVNDQT